MSEPTPAPRARNGSPLSRFTYAPPPELGGPRRGPVDAPVAIVGAGPVGLAMALQLAALGVGCVVLDDNDTVSVGSRAICWAKRTLEIFDRLGVGEAMVECGVTWQTGRVFNGADEVYAFDLQPERGHKMPAFINLQQYTVEALLVARCADFPGLIDLRWKNKVVANEATSEGMRLTVETPDGRYAMNAGWLLACDGARSPTRHRMGLELEGQTFDEQFLIADVEMADDPFDAGGRAERWFWFRPPFHDGQSALLHKQPNDIYRIDLQLGPDADPERERDPDRVIPRIRHMVGDKPFRLEWLSIYRFTCARLERFLHGRVIFLGDAAHVVSPFGARGGNGGIQDVDNLGWKLAAVVKGETAASLLTSYDAERIHAADENIAQSSLSTRFMTPKSRGARVLRDAVLDLSREAPFARRLVNSGRLSTAAAYPQEGLQTPVSSKGEGPAPGMACPDARIIARGRDGFLLEQLGNEFLLLTVGEAARGLKCAGLRRLHVALGGELSRPGDVGDAGEVAERYGRNVGYLVRPDGHVAARFEAEDGSRLPEALVRATGREVALVGQ